MAKTIKLFKKPTPVYKYRLNDLVAELPKTYSIALIVDELKAHGITADEFRRDRAIEYASKSSIPDDRMLVYAQMFAVDVAELRNHTIKAKPLVQVSKIKTTLK